MSLLSEVYPKNANSSDLNVFITSLNKIKNYSKNSSEFLNINVPTDKGNKFNYEIFNENGRICSGKVSVSNSSINFHTLSIPLSRKLQYFIKIEYTSVKFSDNKNVKDRCICKFYKYDNDCDELKLFPHYTESDDENSYDKEEFELCNNIIRDMDAARFGIPDFSMNDNIKCINIDSDDDEENESNETDSNEIDSNETDSNETDSNGDQNNNHNDDQELVNNVNHSENISDNSSENDDKSKNNTVEYVNEIEKIVKDKLNNDKDDDNDDFSFVSELM